MKLIIINGPNLNLIGTREPEIYGSVSFDEYLKELTILFPDIKIIYFQSNIEGEIINKIHETGFTFDGIILNAGGYSHTSIAIADAIASVTTPVIEVHISNIFAREVVRQNSLLSSKCRGVIVGFGLDSYRLAIESLKNSEKR
ncbi:MAG: type II 3-dehydroquinate dehydratase [Bacteroidetes bacterium CG2_30_32_10]|nr:MAG: type II 3-dehydroquinate dehydratase [Bacteroidetes bacterium CG2_30_32_10]